MLVAEPFVSWGRWVARCPVPDCPNAEHHGIESGYPGGLGRDVFRCSFCQMACPVKWPVNAADIERLLVLRPIPSTRNWLPGETLADLLTENAQHGIFPPGVEAGEGRLLILGDDILAGADLLPAGTRRLALER